MVVVDFRNRLHTLLVQSREVTRLHQSSHWNWIIGWKKTAPILCCGAKPPISPFSHEERREISFMATTCISRPASITYMRKLKKTAVVLRNSHICNYAPANSLYFLAQTTANPRRKSSKLCLGNGSLSQWRRRKPKYTSPVMEWQDCRYNFLFFVLLESESVIVPYN
jgi:hypothetical protein